MKVLEAIVTARQQASEITELLKLLNPVRGRGVGR